MAVLWRLVRQDCRIGPIAGRRRRSQFLIRTLSRPARIVTMQGRHVGVTDLH